MFDELKEVGLKNLSKILQKNKTFGDSSRKGRVVFSTQMSICDGAFL